MGTQNMDMEKLSQMVLDQWADVIGYCRAQSMMYGTDVEAFAFAESIYLEDVISLPALDSYRESESAIQRIKEFLNDKQKAQDVFEPILLIYQVNIATQLTRLAGNTDINKKRLALQQVNTCLNHPSLPSAERQFCSILQSELQAEITELSKKNGSCAPKAAAMLIIIVAVTSVFVNWLL